MESAFRAWWQESYGLPPGPHAVMTHVAWGEHLLATRPKPPSLKEQALEQYAHIERVLRDHGYVPAGCVMEALEALSDD